MKTVIFYMSGTGNSLHVAKEIQESLGNCVLKDIGSIYKEKYILKNTRRIGFVYPSYCHDVPLAVREFIKRLIVEEKDPYTFSIVTHNSVPGNTTKSFANKLKDNGINLNYGVDILMPGNGIIISDNTNSIIEVKRRLQLSKKAIKSIIVDITSCKNKLITPFESKESIQRASDAENSILNIYKVYTHFNSNDLCTSCGLCANVCSFTAIEIVKGKPTWNNRCQTCLGCIHYCPSKVINIDKYTESYSRYTHPKISIEEISR